MKKPIFKKWWFWVIIIFVFLMIVSNMDAENQQAVADPSPVSSQSSTQSTPKSTPKATPEPTPDNTPKLTTGQKNVLKASDNYLSFTAFSYTGLIKQLEFEKYSHEDAVFAADNCGADWNEQAAKSAKNYLDLSAFSKDSLIQQLEFEGYTNAQAAYGAKANGY